MSQWGTRPSPFSSVEVTAIRALIGGGVAPTDGQLLIGNTATGSFAIATLTAGAGITITNSAGGITIAASGAGAGGSNTQVQYNSSGSLAGAAGFVFDGTSKITLGVAGTSVGAVVFGNATSGTITVQPATGALGTVTLSLPAATDTLIGKATTDTLTNKTYDTAGTGNVFKINGTGISAVNGSGAVVLTTSAALITPALGVATATSIAIGGATIGSNGLAVTGHVLLEGVTSTGATGTGKLVFDGSPTLVTPTLGVATATSINGLTITSSTGSLTITNGKTLSVSNSIAFAGTDSTTMTFPSTSATIARTDAANTFTGTQTITTIAGLTTVTGAASNMTITAGTGNSRTLILQTTTSGGVATTSLTLNADQTATFAAGVTVAGTLALGANSITMSGSIGVTGTRVTKGWFTDVESTNVPTVGGVALPTLAAGQTWAGQNKFNNIVDVNNAVTVASNAGTVPVTFRLNTFTNSSAATMAITMATASAVDGQMTIVRIYDFSAVAQTIGWTNTENSTVSAPTTSNGSTTLPLTVGFMYNSATSKWRCIASA